MEVEQRKMRTTRNGPVIPKFHVEFHTSIIYFRRFGLILGSSSVQRIKKGRKLHRKTIHDDKNQQGKLGENPGRQGRGKSMEEMQPQKWDRVVESME